MSQITRRDFVKTATLATGASVIGVGGVGAAEYDPSRVLNYNQNMEYRRLGKTNLMVSAVCLGGHWKRVEVALPKRSGGQQGWLGWDIENEDFQKKPAA